MTAGDRGTASPLPAEVAGESFEPPWRFLLRWFAIGLGLGLGACALWWWLVANDALPQAEETIVIPAGTAAAIARGDLFAFAPSRISVPPGTRVVLVNRDQAAHTVGDTVVPAGARATIESLDSGQLSCTIHPSGHMAVSLDSRPPLPAVAAVALGLGVTTAASAWVIRSTTSAPPQRPQQ